MIDMIYRRMGKSGLKLSAFSYGSWLTFSNQMALEPVKESLAMAYDHGVNFFDNAEVYANGKSEELMGAATVLAACGIAYALRYLRASAQGGVEIGFGADLAQLIAAQTMKGAAQLVLEGGLHPEQEIDKVTTPRGVTISGLNEMEHRGFSSALIKGLVVSHDKISRL